MQSELTMGRSVEPRAGLARAVRDERAQIGIESRRPSHAQSSDAGVHRLTDLELAQAQEHTPGDRQRLSDLVDVFMADLPTRMQAIAAALAKSDPAALVGPAHRTTGSAGGLPAPALRDLAEQLTQAGLRGDLCTAQRLLPQIDQRAAALQETVARCVAV